MNQKAEIGFSRVRWIREPMLHFILLGLVVFIANDYLLKQTPEENLIVIDSRVKDDLIQQFQQQKSRAPSSREIDKLVDSWLQSELLYRKGLDMGLAENDPLIRDRVIQKTEYLFRNLAVIKKPSERQLREWYQEKSDDYQKQASYDFEHILIRRQDETAKQEIEEILSQLLAGKETSDFGPAYHQFIRRNRASLGITFGDDFVEKLENMPINRWEMVVSKKGWHAVRMQSLHQAPKPEFEKLEPLLRQDWQKQQQREEVAKLIEELRKLYTIKHQSS
jgi:hypothetical protein